MSQYQHPETNPENQRLEALQQKTAESIRANINARLVGSPSVRQQEQRSVGLKAAEDFDFGTIPEFQKLIDLVAEPAVLEEQLNVVIAFKTSHPDYAQAADNAAAQILNGSVASLAELKRSGSLFNLPREIYHSFERAVAALVLIVILFGAFPVEKVSAASSVPTGTPTALSTETPKPTGTPKPTEQTVAQALPTVTPTPRPIPIPTATVEATPTPEIKIVIVETREVNTTSNIRSGPGTNYPIVGSLQEGATITVTQDLGDWLRITYVDPQTKKEVGSGDDQRYIFASLTRNSEFQRIEIPVVQNPEAGDVSSGEAITGTVPITATETVTPPVQSEGVGGPINEDELLKLATQNFEYVTSIDNSGDLPQAYWNDYLVGEFKEGKWQAIREQLPISDQSLSIFPDLVISEQDGNKYAVQNTLGQSVVVAEWDKKTETWIKPVLDSEQLVKIVAENEIKYYKLSRTAAEAEKNKDPIDLPFGLISVFPGFDVVESGQERSIALTGIVSSGLKVINLPILKSSDGSETGWSMRGVIVSVAINDKNGGWHSVDVLLSTSSGFTNKNGEVFWPDHAGLPLKEDSILSSTIKNGFRQDELAHQAYTNFPAREILVQDEPVLIYQYGIVPGTSGSYKKKFTDAMGANHIDTFDFSDSSTLNTMQARLLAAVLTLGLFPDYTVEGFQVLSEQDLLNLEQKEVNLYSLVGGLGVLLKFPSDQQ